MAEDYLDFEMPEPKSNRRQGRKSKALLQEHLPQRKRHFLRLFEQHFDKFAKWLQEGSNQQELLNERYDDNQNTVLHLAAIAGNHEKVAFLLEHNADPCLTNKSGQTAYECSRNEPVRALFRQFANERNFTRMGFNAAQIPTQEELEERDKEREFERKVEADKQILGDHFRKHKYPHMLHFFGKEKITPKSGERAPLRKYVPCAHCSSEIMVHGGGGGIGHLGKTFCTMECLQIFREKN